MSPKSVPLLLWLLLWSTLASAQQPRKPWLTVTPIHEEPQSRRSHITEDHTGDTSWLMVRRVVIAGNRKTKESIILREMNIHPGDTLYGSTLEAFLEEKRQQLLNTSLFLTVNLFPVRSDPHVVDIHAEVFERQYFLAIPLLSLSDRNFNVWWVDQHHRLDRLNYGVKVYENNLTGNNDRLGLTLQHGYTRQYALRYQLPYFDKTLHQGLGVYVSYSHNREVNYASEHNKQVFLKQDRFLKQQFALGFNYTYKKAIRLVHTVSLSYNAFKVKDTVLELNPGFFPNGDLTQQYLELSYGFSYTGADIWAYPLQGYNVNAGITRRGFGVLGKVDETEINMRTAGYWKLAPRWYGVLDLAAKGHFPGHQPYFLLREMGYSDNYLRGLEYFVEEGDAFSILRSTLKREIFACRVHTRLLPKQFATIPIRLYAKVYGDLGYSHNPGPMRSVLSNKLLYTYGAGVDIVTFYDAILRVEYSLNQLHEKGLFLHFKSAF